MDISRIQTDANLFLNRVFSEYGDGEVGCGLRETVGILSLSDD